MHRISGCLTVDCEGDHKEIGNSEVETPVTTVIIDKATKRFSRPNMAVH